jgi:hypothetical protein
MDESTKDIAVASNRAAMGLPDISDIMKTTPAYMLEQRSGFSVLFSSCSRATRIIIFMIRREYIILAILYAIYAEISIVFYYADRLNRPQIGLYFPDNI